MRRLDDPERAAQERDKPPLVTAAPVSNAARIIALQRTVGNHAVAAMLAREAAPKAAQPAHGLAIVEGLGTIPLVSVTLGEIRPGSSGRGVEKPTPPPRDIGVVSKQGEHSAALALANQRGDVFEVELFVGDKVRLKLHKAMITAFHVNDYGGEGPVDAWTLNAESLEFIADER